MRRGNSRTDPGHIGQALIDETPFTLRSLTRHPVEPHEENWFARCRADYLRSFPLFLLDLVRLVMLVGLVGPSASAAYTGLAVLGWVFIVARRLLASRNEAKPDFDAKQALEYRRGTVRIRLVWWSVMLAWGIMIVPEANYAGLVVIGIAMMTVDGISATSLPHLALGATIAGGIAIIVGVLWSDRSAAAAVAVVVLVLIFFLHWSIYNLYYMFATRRIRTRRLAESNETIRLLLNQYDDEGSDWLYETDSEGRIQNPSSRFCMACGLRPEQLQGLGLPHLFHEGVHRQELQDMFSRGEAFRSLVVPLTVEGEDRWWSISGRPFEQQHGKQKGWRGFIADVTVTKQAEAKIAYMAHYDLLTSLPNRTLFNATLDRMMSRMSLERAAGLLFVDLDHFKEINDEYGHSIGDRVLAETGRRLEESVRPRDMVARLGGDEFAVLLPDLAAPDAALTIARRMLRKIARPIEIDGHVILIGASVGIAIGPNDGRTGDELLRSADLAMYDAKERGRGSISMFDVGMQLRMQERRELELGLRMAVARNELELYYQPFVDIASGEVAGLEALLRWNHPTRGLIMPSDFVPIAEESGSIIEIGEWALRTALDDAARLPGHLTVAVNVSPAQMYDGRLIAMIVKALGASPVPARRLELEITENILIQNTEQVLDLLHELRSIGVRITLDDFGTGYSSLTYLRSFPFDKIKIDRSFVRELPESRDCQAIVQSILSLAADLDMITTAEGVESEAQLDALRERGCTQVQGHLFSEPVPFDRLREAGVGLETGPRHDTAIGKRRSLIV